MESEIFSGETLPDKANGNHEIFKHAIFKPGTKIKN